MGLIKNNITQKDFARIWNTLLSKVRALVKDVNSLPVIVFSFDRSNEDLEKWAFVMERLNSDEEFLHEMKARIGTTVELKVECWDSVVIKAYQYD